MTSRDKDYILEEIWRIKIDIELAQSCRDYSDLDDVANDLEQIYDIIQNMEEDLL